MLKSLNAGKRLILASILGLVFIGTGCTSVVNTQVNTFRGLPDQLAKGAIRVRAQVAEVDRSLEFAWYRGQVEQALIDLGYSLAASPADAEFVALLSYGVETTESSRSNSYVTTGLGYGRSRYFGSSVVVVDDRSESEYLRQVQLVIARNNEAEDRVYEVVGVSKGRCGVLSVVFDEMLAAMLQGFPAENASVKTISVKGDARC